MKRLIMVTAAVLIAFSAFANSPYSGAGVTASLGYSNIGKTKTVCDTFGIILHAGIESNEKSALYGSAKLAVPSEFLAVSKFSSIPRAYLLALGGGYLFRIGNKFQLSTDANMCMLILDNGIVTREIGVAVSVTPKIFLFEMDKFCCYALGFPVFCGWTGNSFLVSAGVSFSLEVSSVFRGY